MSYKDDLEKLSKKELIELIWNILGNYQKEYEKLPFEYCPVCETKLKR